MVAHHTHSDLANEVTRMRPAAKKLGVALMVGGIIAVLIAFFAALGTEGKGQRFWFAYMFGLAAITCVSGAALIVTLINHLVRSGWITNVRRILETFAVQIGLVAVLTLPIIGTVLFSNGTIYSWAVPSDTPIVHHGEGGEEHGAGHDGDGHGEAAHGGDAKNDAKPEGHHPNHPAGESHEAPAATAPAVVDAGEKPTMAHHTEPAGHGQDVGHGEHAAAGAKSTVQGGEIIGYPNHQVQPGVKRDYDANIARKAHNWLNPYFWSLRVLAYFAVLSGIAYYYWSNSVKQDTTGDIDINARLSYQAGPLLLATGLIFTFIAFDVYMSLDPHWFSTMFGVYFFASGTQAMWALMSLFVLGLQARGYLTQSISREVRHDLGKFLWAFIFFFGYIAFSQYMLQWYANLPEETFWFDKRGYSQAVPNGYTPLVVALLFGRFIIPFLGLLSRHVKRNRFGLGFWAVWLLVFFVIDMYLIIMPEYSYTPVFGLPEILAFVGIVGLWFGNVIRVLAGHELRPIRDARVHESLALQNF